MKLAANALGVSKDTVRRDAALNEPKSGAERATKSDRRAQRELELASKQTALPIQRYGEGTVNRRRPRAEPIPGATYLREHGGYGITERQACRCCSSSKSPAIPRR
jgi:hypothetical protein